MTKFELTLEDEILFLDKYKLTPNELVLVKALLILQDEDNEKLFKTYIKVLRDCKINLRELFLSLQEKGVILKSYKIPEGIYDPHEIQLNKNFIKQLYRCSFEIGKELFENYPQFGNINGNVVGLRSISKKFDSLEDAYFRYGRNINWNPEIHENIIELVKWGSEHNIINYTLASFIIDKRWEELKSLKDGEGNINYDNVRFL